MITPSSRCEAFFPERRIAVDEVVEALSNLGRNALKLACASDAGVVGTANTVTAIETRRPMTEHPIEIHVMRPPRRR